MRKVLEKGSVILGVLFTLLLFQICLSKVSATDCIQKEREALLRFKKSFKDPSGRLASWNSKNGSNCCFWDGIACNRTTGHVTKIDLRNNFNQVYHSYYETTLYSNSVDSSLFEFKYLNYLDLSWNDFNHSQIPNFLGSMFELRYLSLSHASFRGIVPHFGNLTQLVFLDLSSYNVDDVEGISHLSSLEYLSLNGMDFSKNFNIMKIVTSLPLLSSLSLNYCNLQNIHLSFDSLNSSFLTRIQLLDMSNNHFNGPIPKIFQNMTSLTSLYLLENQFSAMEGGGLSSLLGNICRLRVFDLSYNLGGDHLFGNYENNESMGCNRYDLQALHLSHTSVKNKIPDWLSKFQNLRLLSLPENSIDGPIPSSLENLSNLEYLDLSNNRLSGSMPIVLKNFKLLEILNLEGNYFSGNIPTWMGHDLKKLEILKLRGNLFNGTIPSSLCNLTRLTCLDLSNNQLDGSIPSNLNNFQAMTGKETTYLKFCNEDSAYDCRDLNNNSVQSIKSNYFDYYSLYLLRKTVNIDLSKNYLVGFIPSEITMLKGLIMLNLSYNNLTGTIPVKIGEMVSLEALDLSFNQLSGSIPKSMSKLNSLVFLKLSHNNLSKDIPKGGQLSTFEKASIFDDDNPYLDGEPLAGSSMESSFEPPFNIENAAEDGEEWILYIMIIFGYVIGFWVVIGSLILKTSWRYAYFNFLDHTQYKLCILMGWTKETIKEIYTHFGNGVKK